MMAILSIIMTKILTKTFKKGNKMKKTFDSKNGKLIEISRKSFEQETREAMAHVLNMLQMLKNENKLLKSEVEMLKRHAFPEVKINKKAGKK